MLETITARLLPLETLELESQIEDTHNVRSSNSAEWSNIQSSFIYDFRLNTIFVLIQTECHMSAKTPITITNQCMRNRNIVCNDSSLFIQGT